MLQSAKAQKGETEELGTGSGLGFKVFCLSQANYKHHGARCQEGIEKMLKLSISVCSDFAKRFKSSF